MIDPIAYAQGRIEAAKPGKPAAGGWQRPKAKAAAPAAVQPATLTMKALADSHIKRWRTAR